VDTLATLTAVAVMPVWSLKALAGIFANGVPPPDEVVLVDEELVELHATAEVATNMTIPSAAMRVFHDAEPKAPP
jgi:hypothetical protein